MSDDYDNPEAKPSQPEQQPPPTAKGNSTLTSGNGFSLIPPIGAEELAELMAQGPTTIFYAAKKTTSKRKPDREGTGNPS
jgi:hypothetical protein